MRHRWGSVLSEARLHDRKCGREHTSGKREKFCDPFLVGEENVRGGMEKKKGNGDPGEKKTTANDCRGRGHNCLQQFKKGEIPSEGKTAQGCWRVGGRREMEACKPWRRKKRKAVTVLRGWEGKP